MKRNLIIRFANPSDINSVTHFRMIQLGTAKEFKLLKPELLANQNGNVFIVEVDGVLISTLQVEPINSVDDFNSKSGTMFIKPVKQSLFPGLYLSKAGTSESYRNLGINSLLRSLVISRAIKNQCINSLTAIGYESAPRLNLLKRIGYNFAKVKIPENGYTLPLKQPLFLFLPRRLFEYSNKKISQEISGIRDLFNLEIHLDQL